MLTLLALPPSIFLSSPFHFAPLFFPFTTSFPFFLPLWHLRLRFLVEAVVDAIDALELLILYFSLAAAVPFVVPFFEPSPLFVFTFGNNRFIAFMRISTRSFVAF